MPPAKRIIPGVLWHSGFPFAGKKVAMGLLFWYNIFNYVQEGTYD